MSEPRKLRGILSTVLWKSPDLDNKWGIFRIKSGSIETAVKGVIPKPRVGMTVEVEGELAGDAIKAKKITEVEPKSPEEVVGHLRSHGVPRVLAVDIQIKYGAETIKTIQGDPNLARSMGMKEEHILALTDNHGFKLMQELDAMGFGPKTQIKILNAYSGKEGQLSRDLRENPYRLIKLEGMGFKSVDKVLLAANVIKPDDMNRLVALTTSVLGDFESQGHTKVTPEQMVAAIEPVRCNVPVAQILNNALEEEYVTLKDGAYSLTKTCRDELELTGAIKGLLKSPKAKFKLPKSYLPKLNEEQANGVKMALTEPISILTGGPGTGKTYTTRTIMDILEEKKQVVWLCAPTGKAARRMAEVTSRDASTIHKLFHKMRIEQDENCDLLIIDETSMVSNELGAELMRETMSRAKRVLYIGDPDQLPSIAPGRVLDDMIESGKIPTTRLTQIMRQEEENSIVHNAANIREGKSLEQGKSFFITETSEEKQVELLTKAFRERIPTLKNKKGESLNPLEDVQVIVPQHAGVMGCENINKVLQNLLNPADPTKNEQEVNGVAYREGDKILITKNSPQAANGEIGVLKAIGNGKLRVAFSDRLEDMPTPTWNDTKLGYAITIHKSQGSEAPMVIVVVNNSTAQPLRQRNLLYTAITRSQEYCWVMTDNKAVLQQCIDRNTPDGRQTRLKEQLGKDMELDTKGVDI